MNNEVISIVIPAYNVEKYIEKCIKSITDQHLDEKKYEIIIVDDGSTDGTLKKCQQLKKVNNLHVYTKQNGGLSDARNYGASKARGEYIWFIDGDDFIAAGSLKRIVKKLREEKPDTLVIQSKEIYESGETKDECNYSIAVGLYSAEGYFGQLAANPKSIMFCAQYHICRKKLLTGKTIFFKKGIIHEDELWTPQILLNSNIISYSGINAYYHLMREGSIMHGSKKEKSGECDIYVANALFDIYDHWSDNLDLTYVRDRAVNIYLQAVWKVPGLVEKNADKRIYLFRKSKYLKTRLKALLYFVSPYLYIRIHKITKG